MPEQLIIDQSDLRKYRTEIPNMADDDLPPFQYKLYAHYKRVGLCYESVRTTAKKTMMSVGQVVKTRDWLILNGWIEMYGEDGSDDTFIIEIVDRWLENFERYANQKPNTVTQSKNWCISDLMKQRGIMENGICTYCGATNSTIIEHWIPKSRGGTNDPANLTLSCSVCNLAKHTMTGEEFIELLVSRGWLIDDSVAFIERTERSQTIDQLRSLHEPKKKRSKAVKKDSDASASGSNDKTQKERPRDLIFDAIALGSWGIRDTRANGVLLEGGRIGAAKKAIVSVDPNVTVEKLMEFYAWFDRNNSGASRPREHAIKESYYSFMQNEQGNGSDDYDPLDAKK